MQDIANEIQVIDLDDTVRTSNDLTLLEWADIVIITEPDEIYSLIAAGWMIGRGKHVILVVCNEYTHDASLYSKLGIIVSTQISLLNDLNKIRLSSMNYTKPIDLGLSVLWADRNLDADDTSKPGGYYYQACGFIDCEDGSLTTGAVGSKYDVVYWSNNLAGDCMYYAQKSDAVYGGGSFFYKSYTKNPAYGYPVRCQKE